MNVEIVEMSSLNETWTSIFSQVPKEKKKGGVEVEEVMLRSLWTSMVMGKHRLDKVKIVNPKAAASAAVEPVEFSIHPLSEVMLHPKLVAL